ncbi:hypothetical protein FOL47_006174 [Perkinsus chesapeaki]|uniref:Uncharacterized protein n=1 Tax=Perkinsus chesapeaki TaxID=330153 RepID=A0A7J6LTC9_PERCH|nr:hypothetical protein FOL47_006174 [Perkinsus chesapeaki]
MPGSSGAVNPAVRDATGQVALEMGRQTLLAASNAAQQGLVQVHHYIQQGPNGLRVLCFVGGLGVTLTGAIGVLNIFSTILHPIDYLCNALVLLLIKSMSFYRSLCRDVVVIASYDLHASRISDLRSRKWFL